jgi:diguanylate cyclase (GGDEF)-like protein
MRVLLAELIASERTHIRHCIEKAGHQVITANTGPEVIAAYLKHAPDLILLDMALPVKNGIDTVFEIRGLSETEENWVPIVLLSEESNPKKVAKGLDAGCDDYLQLPIDEHVFAAKLRAVQRLIKIRKQLYIANHELNLMAVKDGLTGISNRRHFDDVLQKELKRALRTEDPVSLIMSDIDYFKSYNDNYGHQLGDDCLKSIAKIMVEQIKRPADLGARYGGEEFAFILPETDLKEAITIAEMIKASVESLQIPHDYSEAGNIVTISCGVATVYPSQKDDAKHLLHQLIADADKALYQAKDKGRNQVVTASR